MERLVGHPRGEFATRDDVMAMAAVLRGEMVELRSTLVFEVGRELRSRFRAMMIALTGYFVALVLVVRQP